MGELAEVGVSMGEFAFAMHVNKKLVTITTG